MVFLSFLFFFERKKKHFFYHFSPFLSIPLRKERFHFLEKWAKKRVFPCFLYIFSRKLLIRKDTQQITFFIFDLFKNHIPQWYQEIGQENVQKNMFSLLLCMFWKNDFFKKYNPKKTHFFLPEIVDIRNAILANPFTDQTKTEQKFWSFSGFNK